MSVIAEIAADLRDVTTAPGAVRRIAYCRECNRQISAETAAANGGCCNAHAVMGTRWTRSDDYRP